ncbi:hypothetical protein ACFWAT_14970 [Streptomyces syringium]|uniref:hypothetical protein n=1 Tax=Streptomyces syringium TaxID=76729 RepID=UPI00365B5998
MNKNFIGGLLCGTSLAFSALLLTLFIVLLLESLFSAGSLVTYARGMLSQMFPLLAFANLQVPWKAVCKPSSLPSCAPQDSPELVPVLARR